MKHFSAIIMSLAVASAVASPVTKLSQKSLQVSQPSVMQKLTATERQQMSQFQSFMAPTTSQPRRAAGDVVEYTSSVISSGQYYSSTGDWYVGFRTDQGGIFYLDIFNYANPGVFDGTYTEADCDLYYTYYSDLVNYDYMDVETINLTCSTPSGNGNPVDGCTVVGSGTFTNGTAFTLNFNISNEVPEITDYATLDIVGAEVIDLVASMGVFQVFYESSDLSLSIVCEADEFKSGYYSMSSDYRDYCLIYETEEIKMSSCDIYLDVQADGNCVVDGTFQAGSTLYTLHLTTAADPNAGDPYDDPDNDLNLTYSLDEVTITTGDNSVGNYTLITALRDNTKLSMVLQHGEGTLEAGIYPFTIEVVPGYAWAGEISGNSVFPTFYATVNDEGLLELPLWLFSNGQVVVTMEGDEPSFVIDATNTWGRSAHVEINVLDTPVAIEALATEAAKTGKFLRDGALEIRTATRTFNAMGQAK